MPLRINLNSDMGESFGRWHLGNDAELMRYVPTINIACGFHAGDPHVMRRTVELAAESGVEIGAHPSLPDILGFGRRRLQITGDELRDYILYQVGALQGFAQATGQRLRHVKPHGALYAMCGESEEYARALLEAVRALDPEMTVIAGGAAVAAASASTGVRAVPEGYVDLAYQPNGFPVLERAKMAWDPHDVAGRAVRIVRERRLEAVDGSTLTIDVPTVCIHGDAPNAIEVARAVRQRLAAESIEVVALSEVLSYA
ncbi:MAG: LamB/YcsF family protein [Alphaproteobacteria bacterium]